MKTILAVLAVVVLPALFSPLAQGRPVHDSGNQGFGMGMSPSAR